MTTIIELGRVIAERLHLREPKELLIAKEKRKMQRELQDQGLSRNAAMRAVPEHYSKVATRYED